jgi:hypothetical protein
MNKVRTRSCPESWGRNDTTSCGPPLFPDTRTESGEGTGHSAQPFANPKVAPQAPIVHVQLPASLSMSEPATKMSPSTAGSNGSRHGS